jgi:hypothetical protein
MDGQKTHRKDATMTERCPKGKELHETWFSKVCNNADWQTAMFTPKGYWSHAKVCPICKKYQEEQYARLHPDLVVK